MTASAWIVYCLAVSVLIAPGAWLLERGLAHVGWPTRWAWLGALGLCLALPLSASLRPAATLERPPSIEVSVSAAEPGAASSVRRSGPGTLGTVRHLIGKGRAAADRALASLTEGIASRPGVERWIVSVWSTMSTGVALVLLASMTRLAIKMRIWPREMLRGRSVRISPALGPATVGLLEPTIVLPAWATALEEGDLELVLAHEAEHVRGRDPLLLALGLLPFLTQPWNPLVWWQFRRLAGAVEVDCDRRVLRTVGEASRYGRLLLELGSRVRANVIPVPTISGSPSLLERRLSAMKKNTRNRPQAIRRATGAMVPAALLLAVACTTEPPAAGGGPEATAPVAEPGTAEVVIAADGSVSLNGARHRMDEVGDLVTGLQAASAEPLVISISGDPRTPYRVVEQLQQQLVAAGVTRVVFDGPTAASAGAATSPGGGLGIVLPEQGESATVSVRNMLFLTIQETGIVLMRRGEATEEQEMLASEVESLWRHDVALNPTLIAAVKIRPGAEYRYVMWVLDALHAAHAERISIQTLPI